MPPAPTTPDALFAAFQTALAGRYSIDRELGRGGMGVVYLAPTLSHPHIVPVHSHDRQ